MKTIEQQTDPRCSTWGADHGAEGRVIARNGNRRLIWRLGHTGWSGRGSTSYYPARLEVINPKGAKTYRTPKAVHEGGRLSKAVLKEHAATIREMLDLPEDAPDVHEAYKRGKTVDYTEDAEQ
jgi:hypothetical protein